MGLVLHSSLPVDTLVHLSHLGQTLDAALLKNLQEQLFTADSTHQLLHLAADLVYDTVPSFHIRLQYPVHPTDYRFRHLPHILMVLCGNRSQPSYELLPQLDEIVPQSPLRSLDHIQIDLIDDIHHLLEHLRIVHLYLYPFLPRHPSPYLIQELAGQLLQCFHHLPPELPEEVLECSVLLEERTEPILNHDLLQPQDIQ